MSPGRLSKASKGHRWYQPPQERWCAATEQQQHQKRYQHRVRLRVQGIGREDRRNGEKGSHGALVVPEAKWVQTHKAATQRLTVLEHPLR